MMNKTKSIECHCGSQIRNVHVKKYKCKSLKCSSNIGCYYTFDVGLENVSFFHLDYKILSNLYFNILCLRLSTHFKNYFSK